MQKPRKPHRRVMTPSQVDFVRAMAKTGDLTYASRKAGYTGPQGGIAALNSPDVQAALLEEHKRILLEVLAPASLQHLGAVLAVKAPDGGVERAFARVQNDAAKIVLAETRHFRDAASGKELHEMSLEESQTLLEAIRRRMREEAEDAEIIEPDPPVAPPGDSVFG